MNLLIVNCYDRLGWKRLAKHNREKSLGGENVQELFARREAQKNSQS